MAAGNGREGFDSAALPALSIIALSKDHYNSSLRRVQSLVFSQLSEEWTNFNFSTTPTTKQSSLSS